MRIEDLDYHWSTYHKAMTKPLAENAGGDGCPSPTIAMNCVVKKKLQYRLVCRQQVHVYC
jgi:hypothetical protein